ncbi:MAG TPA: FKBP-type peptidyl-prolyl cis-trans isomerase [Gemmatimonadales bacterium]|nr:FKBP-type peptidyl-prolyl cis-trans isomerase [Gemmatimonadales bacterium]
MPLSLLLPIFCLTVAAPQSGRTHLRLDRPMEMFWTSTTSGVSYQVLSSGRGPAAIGDDRVLIHETVSLMDGRVLHSTRTIRTPITVSFTTRQAMRGAEGGIAGMKQGERRRILVPAHIGPSALDQGVVPPNTVRVYDIEVLAVMSDRTH